MHSEHFTDAPGDIRANKEMESNDDQDDESIEENCLNRSYDHPRNIAMC